MSFQVRAVYRDGAFVLRERCDLPQETEVNLIIQGPMLAPPVITEPAERASFLRAMTERIRQNPLPAEAVRFSRDELHERR
jgi:hypothetical protein